VSGVLSERELTVVYSFVKKIHKIKAVLLRQFPVDVRMASQAGSWNDTEQLNATVSPDSNNK
jgi:hypothetical protein